MFFYIIGIILLFYGIVDYKKAFMGYLVFRLVLVQNITLISLPGVPLLTLEVFLSLFFVGLYFLKRGQLEEDLSPFPLKIPFFFLLASWSISTIFAIVGFGSAMSQYMRDVCQNIILIIINTISKFFINRAFQIIYTICCCGMLITVPLFIL